MNNKSDILPSIRPASDLRTKFSQVMNEIYESDRPVFLTKKGRCDTVIMSADTFSQYKLSDNALLRNFREATIAKDDLDNEDGINCSFCLKPQNTVDHIVVCAGTEISICSECIELCQEILEKENGLDGK